MLSGYLSPPFLNCQSRRKRADAERGNVLFLILIAVALFAALAYAITQSGRSGAGISNQQAMLYAAQITQTCQDIATGVQRMTLNGTPANTITAGTPATASLPGFGTLTGNADFCTSGPTCLFAPDGGNVPLPSMPRAAMLPAWPPFAGAYFITPHGMNGIIIDGLAPGTTGLAQPYNAINGVGTAAADDNIQVQPLQKAVCQAINSGLGISGIPVVTMAATPYPNAACIDPIGDGSQYTFYQVLIAH